MNKRNKMANYLILLLSGPGTRAKQTGKCPNVSRILVDFSSILSSIKKFGGEPKYPPPHITFLNFLHHTKYTLQSSQGSGLDLQTGTNARDLND